MRCPRCAAPLAPASARHELLFICENGHEIPGHELEPEAASAELNAAVAELDALGADALRRGAPEVAAFFHRQREAAAERLRAILGRHGGH